MALTPDDRLYAIKRVKELGKAEIIEDFLVTVDAARDFCYLYDRLSKTSRIRLKSYPTKVAINLARPALKPSG